VILIFLVSSCLGGFTIVIARPKAEAIQANTEPYPWIASLPMVARNDDWE